MRLRPVQCASCDSLRVRKQRIPTEGIRLRYQLEKRGVAGDDTALARRRRRVVFGARLKQNCPKRHAQDERECDEESIANHLKLLFRSRWLTPWARLTAPGSIAQEHQHAQKDKSSLEVLNPATALI